MWCVNWTVCKLTVFGLSLSCPSLGRAATQRQRQHATIVVSVFECMFGTQQRGREREAYVLCTRTMCRLGRCVRCAVSSVYEVCVVLSVIWSAVASRAWSSLAIRITEWRRGARGGFACVHTVMPRSYSHATVFAVTLETCCHAIELLTGLDYLRYRGSDVLNVSDGLVLAIKAN